MMPPLFDPNGQVVPPPSPVTPTPVVETASIYQNTNNRVKAIPHIEGNTWTIDYFGRLIGDMDPATLDTDIEDPTLIQYQLIQKMEIRVTQELTQSTDEQTQTTTVTGMANMYPIVLPIVGDVFIAPMGDGTYGKFVITAAERQSIYKESAWQVSYTLSEYASEAVIEALMDKVVATLIFDLKGLNESGGALATESEYNRTILRKKMVSDMIERYYEEFYVPTIKTFMVPDVNRRKKVYDPFVVEFWNYLIGKEQTQGKLAPHQYDYRNAIFKTDFVTVWDAILRQDRNVLTRAVHSMREMGTSEFQISYVYFTFHATGIDFIILPKHDMGIPVTGGTDLLVDPLPPYVFSAEFYANAETGQSDLELQVQKAIDGIILAFSDLKPLYDQLNDLTPLERFYQIPLLIALFMVSR